MTLFGKSKNENPELNETALKFTCPSPLIFFSSPLVLHYCRLLFKLSAVKDSDIKFSACCRTVLL